jgi:hypothetical protein
MRSGRGSKQCKGKIVWKTIWALNVPNAVKMFMWKACNDLLPKKMNLLHRGVIHNALCPICKREVDTVKHILWSYPAAQDV